MPSNSFWAIAVRAAVWLGPQAVAHERLASGLGRHDRAEVEARQHAAGDGRGPGSERVALVAVMKFALPAVGAASWRAMLSS